MRGGESDDIRAIREECEGAVETILGAVDRITARAKALAETDPAASADLRSAAADIMQACAFQDLVGQRLTRLANGPEEDVLLSGPGGGGSGLSEAELEALMAAPV